LAFIPSSCPQVVELLKRVGNVGVPSIPKPVAKPNVVFAVRRMAPLCSNLDEMKGYPETYLRIGADVVRED